MKLNLAAQVLSVDTGEPYPLFSHHENKNGDKVDTSSMTGKAINEALNSGELVGKTTPITVGKALILACDQPMKDPTPKAIMDRITIMAKIRAGINKKKEVEFNSENITLLKELVTAGINPTSLSGAICHILEGKTELEELPLMRVEE